MTNVVIFANNKFGLDFIKACQNNSRIGIKAIVINAESKRSLNFKEDVLEIIENHNSRVFIFEWSARLMDDKSFLELVNSSEIGLSAFFGHVLPSNLISRFKRGIINLHPSYLPIGKGSHPIVWSLLERKVQGVTIHLMDSGIDTGDILWQKEIATSLSDTSGDIYVKASELLLLNSIPKILDWVDGKIDLMPNPAVGSTHKSGDLDKVLEKEITEIDSLVNHINWINALNFSNGKKAIVRDFQGNRWSIELIMNQVEGDFE
jgi:methionyl-tRNA formyltransferase